MTSISGGVEKGDGTRDTSLVVAIAYDFDGTLVPGNMQEHVFLPKLGIDKREFWDRSNALAREQQGDKILTYMHEMLRAAEYHRQPMRREDWQEHGREIRFFPGVETWFDRINAAGAERGIQVQHFIISSGLREMIDGSSIRPSLTKVFASAFLYDGSGVAVAPALAVNYTTKTQFLFRINKGVLDVTDDEAVNAYVEHDKRAIPFANMVFIGDGDTDIPSFRLVKEQGGHSIAVLDPARMDKVAGARTLLQTGRVHCVVAADFTAGGDLERRVLAVLDVVRARAFVTSPSFAVEAI
jgi:phosphoserine phosphatase